MKKLHTQDNLRDGQRGFAVEFAMSSGRVRIPDPCCRRFQRKLTKIFRFIFRDLGHHPFDTGSVHKILYEVARSRNFFSPVTGTSGLALPGRVSHVGVNGYLF